MVQIVPPPGWTPAAPPAPAPAPMAPNPPGPPPLDRVAASDSLALDLEPVATWQFRAIFHQMWFFWGMALVVVALIVWGLWTVLMPEPSAETAPVETRQPAAAGVKKAANEETAKKAEKSEKGEKSEKDQKGKDDAAQKPPTPVAPPPVTPTSEDKSTSSPSTPSPLIPPPEPTPPDAEEAVQDAAKDQENKEKDEIVKPEAEPEIKKLPPPHVDLAARLADPLASIELTDVPLARAMELLSTLSTVPITLDADALVKLGVSPRDRVSSRLEATTVAAAIKAIAAERGLTARVEGDQVVVGVPAESRKTLKTVRYAVSDLIGDEKDAVVEFAALVQKLVAPDSWQSAGGQGGIETAPGELVVAQTADVHRQVLAFCEKLRQARKKPLRAGGDPEQFTLTTRRESARKMLGRPVSANYHEPTPLVKILAYLAETTGGDILIDRAALAAAETSDRVEASVSADRRSLEAILDELLPPLGLGYRVVGPALVQVTTREAVEERPELEFYPVEKLLSDGTTAEQWIARLKIEIEPATWADAGGLGEAHFDAASKYLIVLQSQPVQAAVARLLTPKKAAK